MTLTIFEHIDAADDAGFYVFVAEKHKMRRSVPTGKAAMLRHLIEAHFQGHSPFGLNLVHVKTWLAAIETTGSTDSKGDWRVRLNLARFFLLPGIEPAKELAELRCFYEAMKPFFEDSAPATKFADIHVHNERESSDCVVQILSCRVRKSLGGDVTIDGAHTERLRSKARASPVLRSFLLEAGRALQRARSRSWSGYCITEEQLYGRDASPWYAHYIRDHRLELVGEPTGQNPVARLSLVPEPQIESLEPGG